MSGSVRNGVQSTLAPSSSGQEQAGSIQLRVNGVDRDVPAGSSIADLITLLGLRRELVAVEVNRRLIRRAQHAEHVLLSGDHVEVVEFVGGG